MNRAETESMDYINNTLTEMTNEYFEGQEPSYYSRNGFAEGIVYTLICNLDNLIPERIVNPRILAANLYQRSISDVDNEELIESVDYRQAFMAAVIWAINIGI